MKINKSFILFALFLSSLQARVENVEFVAKEVHKVGDIVTATGNVLVYSPSYLISAKRAKYDEKNEVVELFENVSILRNNEEATNSNYAKINLKTNEITTDNTFAMHQNKELWIASEQFCSSDARIDTSKSIVSSCNVDEPDWHIEYKDGYLDKQKKYLHIYNPVFYGNLPFVGNTPLFYLPYFGFSTDKTRRTGFLTPKISFSKSEGLFFEQPFYIAEYNEWDLELNPQIRTNRGVGLYATFRFADSPYSSGYIRTGFFKDSKKYQDKNSLKYSTHTGAELEYDRDKLAKYLVNGDYSEGLYVRFKQLNDFDYLNLRENGNSAYDSLVHSKINYFVNTKEHYFGIYADYYINTAKIATKYGNKDTLQELPTLQYHSYLDSFLSKNLTYSLDIKYHNYTRKIGTKAQQFELNLPVGLNFTLPSGWANLSYTHNLYASHISYQKSFELDKKGFMRDKKNEKYARSWSEIALSSDLARAYDGGLFHAMNLKLSYIQPGYKYGEIAERLYSFDKDESEENFVEQLDKKYQRQTLNAGIIQYLFNSDNKKILRHSLNTSYYTNKGRFATTDNRLDLYFDYFNAFSKLTYDHEKKRLISAQNGIATTYNKLYFDIRDSYDVKFDDLNIKSKSHFLQTSAHYTFPKDIRVFGSYAYDYVEKYTKMWQIGISQYRKCWNYGIYFRRNTDPINTSTGPEPKTKNSVMVFFAFYPFGDFNYDFLLKSKDVMY
ncbi:MAG: LPS assembly protein LptD [Campylobacter sp.]|nr:LPS assembly protein LptD [Campylobacter sp.]